MSKEPTYNDPMDASAISILQGFYIEKTVIGIDVRDLYAYGGMIHCITQQQPIDTNSSGIEGFEIEDRKLVGIYDILGRPADLKVGALQIYLYSDGSTERVFVAE